MVHQCQQIAGEGPEMDLGSIPGRMCLPVSPTIEGDVSKARRGFEQTKRLADIRTQPVLEKEGDARALVADENSPSA